MNRTLCVILLLASITGCTAEVGSDRWCANLADRPKGDWSMNEAGDYARHCILK